MVEEVEPANVAQAVAIGAALNSGETTTKRYEITGYVSYISEVYSEWNKNESFWISDDPTDVSNDKATHFYVYGGRPSTKAELGLHAKVKFVTTIKNYNGTIETPGQGAAYMYASNNEKAYQDFSPDIVIDTTGCITCAQAVAQASGHAVVVGYAIKPNAKSGRITNWIMHNEVDQQITWTNMGQQPELRYANEYVKSMRMASLIAHQYDPNAAVLTSLTHSWAEAEGQYASRDLLDDINALSSAEGDFWWGVGYHAYPQILFQPAFWSGDTESTYSMDSKYVTFKNLEVLSAWALSSANKYKGSTKRLVWLSENGTNAMSYSDDHLSQQAAGVAWMWKKVSRLDGIDAVQWHNWRDNPEEGLNLGLRKNTENSSAAKPAYSAYQAAGTSSEDSVFAPYLSVIGISSWDEIHHDL